jgi:hypothetical protein
MAKNTPANVSPGNPGEARSGEESGRDHDSPLLSVGWSREINEQGGAMLLFGSWLVDDEGTEGDWFYSGRGDCEETYEIPSNVIGVRIRRWPSEGLDPEYADINFAEGAIAQITTDALDFDTKQNRSRLWVN